MQTPTPVPGQVLSQGARGPQQNGNASISTGLPWPGWQSEHDTGLRRRIVDNILQLFKNRKPHVTPEWQQKLPDFVKRLEEALYKNAPSKDEYADLKTLEQRLQSVARRMVPKQPSHPVGSSAPTGNMISTPGAASNMIPTPGNGSNMMPAPGSVASMMSTTGTAGNLTQPGAGVAGGLNNMMPTPCSNNLINTMTHGAGTMMSTAGSLSNMMPSPGHSNMFNISGSNIVTTPGISGPNYNLVSQQAMGSMRMAQNGHVPSSMSVPVGSQMIPTPGLNTSQGLGMGPASCSGP